MRMSAADARIPLGMVLASQMLPPLLFSVSYIITAEDVDDPISSPRRATTLRTVQGFQ
jgi:hypothetical protein